MELVSESLEGKKCLQDRWLQWVGHVGWMEEVSGHVNVENSKLFKV